MSDERAAFEVLGLGTGVGEREVRAAFRRLAGRLHPDRFPGNRLAHERFKRIVRAYEIALALSRGETPPGRRSHRRSGQRRRAAHAAVRRPRFRFACPGCDDTFEVDGDCFRCDETLSDTWRGERRAPRPDARVDEMVARLERPPAPPAFELPLPEGSRPWLAVGAFLGLAALVADVGLPGLGLMLAAFAALVAATEISARLERPRIQRLYGRF